MPKKESKKERAEGKADAASAAAENAAEDASWHAPSAPLPFFYCCVSRSDRLIG